MIKVGSLGVMALLASHGCAVGAAVLSFSWSRPDLRTYVVKGVVQSGPAMAPVSQARVTSRVVETGESLGFTLTDAGGRFEFRRRIREARPWWLEVGSGRGFLAALCWPSDPEPVALTPGSTALTAALRSVALGEPSEPSEVTSISGLRRFSITQQIHEGRLIAALPRDRFRRATRIVDGWVGKRRTSADLSSLGASIAKAAEGAQSVAQAWYSRVDPDSLYGQLIDRIVIAQTRIGADLDAGWPAITGRELWAAIVESEATRRDPEVPKAKLEVFIGLTEPSVWQGVTDALHFRLSDGQAEPLEGLIPPDSLPWADSAHRRSLLTLPNLRPGPAEVTIELRDNHGRTLVSLQSLIGLQAGRTSSLELIPPPHAVADFPLALVLDQVPRPIAEESGP